MALKKQVLKGVVADKPSALARVLGLRVRSTLDGSDEDVLFIRGRRTAPLVVSLHAWSEPKERDIEMYREIHRRTGWSVLAPEFRGVNLKTNPRARQACASRRAKQDVVDAVRAVIRNYRLAPPAIFLRGGSGGAHMALMMAGYAPTLWTAVCAWCPVTDLRDRGIWAQFDAPDRRNADFRAHVQACCGRDVLARSPVGHIDRIARATVHLFHGKNDRALPFRTQSLAFYNTLIRRHPDAKCYLSIFNGGHEANLDETLRVFERYL